MSYTPPAGNAVAVKLLSAAYTAPAGDSVHLSIQSSNIGFSQAELVISAVAVSSVGVSSVGVGAFSPYAAAVSDNPPTGIVDTRLQFSVASTCFASLMAQGVSNLYVTATIAGTASCAGYGYAGILVGAASGLVNTVGEGSAYVIISGFGDDYETPSYSGVADVVVPLQGVGVGYIPPASYLSGEIVIPLAASASAKYGVVGQGLRGIGLSAVATGLRGSSGVLAKPIAFSGLCRAWVPPRLVADAVIPITASGTATYSRSFEMFGTPQLRIHGTGFSRVDNALTYYIYDCVVRTAQDRVQVFNEL